MIGCPEPVWDTKFYKVVKFNDKKNMEIVKAMDNMDNKMDNEKHASHVARAG